MNDDGWWWAFRRPMHRDPFLAWVVVVAVVVAVWPFLGAPPAWVPGSSRELAAGLIVRFAFTFFWVAVFAGSIRSALSRSARSRSSRLSRPDA